MPVVLFFEIMLVAATLVITWFALYTLVPADHRRVVTSDRGPDKPVGPAVTSDAVQAAAERAKVTAARNIPAFDDLPVPADTANLRKGANLNDALLALLPLVGVWRGEGEGRGPDGDYRFGQQIVVSHDGGDYLIWESRSWRLDDTGEYQEPGLRETGFWRFVSDPDDPSESQAIELLLAHSAGYVELFYGRPRNQSSWELVTDALARVGPACWSGAPSGSTASSKAAIWLTSRNAWTRTAGWCRICRRGCPGSSDSAVVQTWSGPRAKLLVGQDRSSGAGWLRGIRQRARAASFSEPVLLARSHLTCP